MIEGVKLRNWKSHLESDFSFSGGVNMLVGLMGSGKSSIMDGICFALFGTFPGLQSRKVGVGDIVMKRPQRKTRASVELRFSMGGSIYTILREVEVGKGTVSAEIRNDGTLLQTGTQAVTDEVESLLGMDYDLFSKAVYSEQNALDYFLRIPRGQRMGHIDKMLGVDRFEKARSSAVSMLNSVRSRQESSARVVREMEEEGYEDALSRTRDELKAMEERRISIRDERERSSAGLGKMEQSLEDYEKGRERLEDRKMRLERLRAAIGELEKALSKPLAEPAEGLPDIVGLEKEMRALEDDISSSRGRIAEMNAEMRIARDAIIELDSLGDRCHVCQSPITKMKKEQLIRERREKESSVKEEITSAAAEIEKLEARRSEKEKSYRGALEKKAQAEALMRERGKRAEQEQRLRDIRKESEDVMKEIEGIVLPDVRTVREEHKRLVARVTELGSRLEVIEERMKEKQDLQTSLKKKVMRLEGYRKESGKGAEKSRLLELFVSALASSQERVREEFLKSVNGILESIWPELYPYQDFSSVRLSVDRDYILQIKDSEGWTNVEGMASGGERSIASLALRIAFSMAFLPNLRWLILDEPTHNLDEKAIRHLSEVLGEKISVFAEQVFLITHEDRLSDYLQGTLYRLERNKSENGATEVSA